MIRAYENLNLACADHHFRQSELCDIRFDLKFPYDKQRVTKMQAENINLLV
jgi:hypothetical protein